MAFIEEEWWKDTKWFKIFLAGCAIAFLAFCLVYNLFLKPDLEYIEKTFGVSVSTSEAVRLYSHNTQGWFGDGEDYSVWQYQNPETLMTSIEWQKGQAFQYDIFERVTTRGIELPEGYFLPRELDQEVLYYYVDDDDNELIIVFAPEVKLGDGKYYDNLLFVAAWYS
jgi:hypothetical protein